MEEEGEETEEEEGEMDGEVETGAPEREERKALHLTTVSGDEAKSFQ